MNITNLKQLVKLYGFLYLTTLVILFSLKLFYRNADCDALQWILAPTAWWVRILSGISFENIPHIGYVNHDLRFIIARSCSGFQFMMITAAVLIFSFLHRIVPSKNTNPYHHVLYGFGGLIGGFALSYVLTILVNGMRIILSIYLPLFLEGSVFFQKYDIYSGWLTPDRLHTLIGTVVYFASLLIIYQLIDRISLKISQSDNYYILNANSALKLLQPAFWYFFFVLGIPLLNKAYVNGQKQFTDYAVLIFFTCMVLLILFALPNIIEKKP